MMKTCTHDSSIVVQDFKGFSILRCTWACGLELIELHLDNHEVKTFTVAELAAQSAQIARLREALEPFANAAQSIESSPLSKHWHDSKQITVGVMVDDVITLGDLRLAARALEEVTG